VKFAFIAAEKALLPVAPMCEVLGVSRSGFYAWVRRSPSARACEDQRLAVEVAAVHAKSGRRYGSPRIHAELREPGRGPGRNRVARLMREQGLRARQKRRFRTTTDSRHDLPIAANVLDRCFVANEPNRVWVTDITYLATVEGWLYLAVVLDLFSRRVVGWATSDRLGEGVALEALGMGVARRRPRNSQFVCGRAVCHGPSLGPPPEWLDKYRHESGCS